MTTVLALLQLEARVQVLELRTVQQQQQPLERRFHSSNSIVHEEHDKALKCSVATALLQTWTKGNR